MLLFEQQPNESLKQFEAFRAYLDMGRNRSLDAVALKLNRARRTLATWSQKFNWPARAAAHNNHLADIERQAAEAIWKGKAQEWVQRQTELREQEWAVHTQCLKTATALLERLLAQKSCPPLRDIARLLELASKLGRLAAGLPTDRTELAGQDGGPIRIEIESALKKVYGEVIDVTPELNPTPRDRDTLSSTLSLTLSKNNEETKC